eukprot:1393914-Rhodomonas_salina.1
MVALATVIATRPNEIVALDACNFMPGYPGDPEGSAAFHIKKRKNDQRGHCLLPRIARACSGPKDLVLRTKLLLHLTNRQRKP